MKHLEGIILDWAGTTIDFGCFAPVEVFIRVFEEAGITVTMEEARAPMGMLKIDHIRTMLEMPRVHELWKRKYNRPFEERDVQELFDKFEPLLMKSLAHYTTPIPGVLEAVKAIRSMGLKIGSTTGYNDSMMACVTVEAEKQGYQPDCWITPDTTGQSGRPLPYMIYRNMEKLKISRPWNLVKIGDTVSDIQEGLNASAWSVGVAIGSSVMGVSESEFNQLTLPEKDALITKTKATFLEHGAHYAIDSMEKLPTLLEVIDEKLANSQRPL